MTVLAKGLVAHKGKESVLCTLYLHTGCEVMIAYITCMQFKQKSPAFQRKMINCSDLDINKKKGTLELSRWPVNARQNAAIIFEHLLAALPSMPIMHQLFCRIIKGKIGKIF